MIRSTSVQYLGPEWAVFTAKMTRSRHTFKLQMTTHALTLKIRWIAKDDFSIHFMVVVCLYKSHKQYKSQQNVQA